MSIEHRKTVLTFISLHVDEYLTLKIVAPSFNISPEKTKQTVIFKVRLLTFFFHLLFHSDCVVYSLGCYLMLTPLDVTMSHTKPLSNQVMTLQKLQFLTTQMLIAFQLLGFIKSSVKKCYICLKD